MPAEHGHGPLDGLTLGELQLVALGLWVIGEENRVDLQLMPEYRGLCARVQVAVQREVVNARDRLNVARRVIDEDRHAG